jgi:hypothetical protein
MHDTCGPEGVPGGGGGIIHMRRGAMYKYCFIAIVALLFVLGSSSGGKDIIGYVSGNRIWVLGYSLGYVNTIGLNENETHKPDLREYSGQVTLQFDKRDTSCFARLLFTENELTYLSIEVPVSSRSYSYLLDYYDTRYKDNSVLHSSSSSKTWTDADGDYLIVNKFDGYSLIEYQQSGSNASDSPNHNHEDPRQVDKMFERVEVEYDDMEEVLWIKSKLPDSYLLKDSITAYFGIFAGEIGPLRLKATYWGDDWLFTEKLIFKSDDVRYTSIVFREQLMTEVIGGGRILEVADVFVPSEDMKTVRELFADDEIKMRYSGSSYYRDRIVSSSEIDSINAVLKLYGEFLSNSSLAESLPGSGAMST